jgi:hypothetical protein
MPAEKQVEYVVQIFIRWRERLESVESDMRVQIYRSMRGIHVL